MAEPKVEPNAFVTKFVNFQKDLAAKLEGTLVLEKQDRLDLFKIWMADDYETRVMNHQEKMLKLEIEANAKLNQKPERDEDEFPFGGR